jgi:hypothetical protein
LKVKLDLAPIDFFFQVKKFAVGERFIDFDVPGSRPAVAAVIPAVTS